MNREDQIRQKAYYLWLNEGCPEGRALDHWQRATELVGNEPPAAGPHAAAKLTNEAATAGTGMLAPPDSEDPNQAPSG